MPRIALIFLISLSLRCMPAYAAESAAAPPISKRQLSECMTRRMAAHRTLSYNDAAKVCKEQLTARKLDAPSETAKGVGGT